MRGADSKMNKLITGVFAILISFSLMNLVSCSNNSNEPCVEKEFEIVSNDYYKDYLQRVFIVIDSTRVLDSLFIQKVVCELKTQYDFQERTSVSFFTEKKYANYKTNLFVNEDHSLPRFEYNNWLNFYYLGEFDNEDKTYKTFPVSSNRGLKQKLFYIECN